MSYANLLYLYVCTGRVHYSSFGKRYHFSWKRDGAGRNAEFTWAAARNYCR